MASSAMVLDPKPLPEPPATLPSLRSDSTLTDPNSGDDDSDLYSRLKALQRQNEFIDIPTPERVHRRTRPGP